MKERRDNGLYYYCDEKLNLLRKCRKAKLCVMEGMDLEWSYDDDEVCHNESTVEEEQGTVQTIEGEAPEISLHDIASSLSPRTMRVIGKIKG